MIEKRPVIVHLQGIALGTSIFKANILTNSAAVYLRVIKIISNCQNFIYFPVYCPDQSVFFYLSMKWLYLI